MQQFRSHADLGDGSMALQLTEDQFCALLTLGRELFQKGWAKDRDAGSSFLSVSPLRQSRVVCREASGASLGQRLA